MADVMPGWFTPAQDPTPTPQVPATFQIPTPPAPTSENSQQQTPAEETFTQAQVIEWIEKARKEEKDKLYGELDKYKSDLTELKDDFNSRREAEAEAAKQQEEAVKAAEREKMSAQELIAAQQQDFMAQLQAREEQWNKRLEEEVQQRQTFQATLEKERQFNDLREYAQQAVASHQEDIAPELLDLITGDSKEEIDASIDHVLKASAAIGGRVQEFMGQQQGYPAYGQPIPQPMAPKAASVSTGPTNMDPVGTTTLTADDVRNMSMSDYAKNRTHLLGAAVSRQGVGMYG